MDQELKLTPIQTIILLPIILPLLLIVIMILFAVVPIVLIYGALTGKLKIVVKDNGKEKNIQRKAS